VNREKLTLFISLEESNLKYHLTLTLMSSSSVCRETSHCNSFLYTMYTLSFPYNFITTYRLLKVVCCVFLFVFYNVKLILCLMFGVFSAWVYYKVYAYKKEWIVYYVVIEMDDMDAIWIFNYIILLLFWLFCVIQ